jgi:hypothetical protein
VVLPVYVTASSSQQSLKVDYTITDDAGGGSVALEAVAISAGP